jgi:hypothetical protein
MSGSYVIESLGGQSGEELPLHRKEKPSSENAKVGIGPVAFRARYHAFTCASEPTRSDSPARPRPEAATQAAPASWITQEVTISDYHFT